METVSLGGNPTRGVGAGIPARAVGRMVFGLSLRTKVVLALLVTGLMAGLMVAGIAQWMVLRQFSQAVFRMSFDRFRNDVAAYLETYGSWDRGMRVEEFHHFEFRRRRRPRSSTRSGPGGREGRPSTAPDGRSAGWGPPPGVDTEIRPGRPPGTEGEAWAGEPGPGGGWAPPPGAPARVGKWGAPARPSPPNGGGYAPPDVVSEGPDRPAPQSPPPPEWMPGSGGITQPNRPLFRFLLADKEGRVIHGDSAFSPGQTVPEHLWKQGVPIYARGGQSVVAIPLPTRNISPLSVTYLAAVRESLGYGLIGAAGVALLLGVVLGSRLNRDLQQLTHALQAVEAGALGLQVAVSSRDEVGRLAGTFNRMSAELARAQAELQASHAQVQLQALQLQEQSQRDPLTGLHNRRFFDEQATLAYARAMRHDRALTLVLADLDHFKQINDHYSHAVGDTVLRRIGRLFQAHVRSTDLVARYGGEEFVLALDECSPEKAASICEHLRGAVADYPWDEVAPGLRVTLSLGLCGNTALSGVEPMLAEADAQLYRAKKEGRNRVCAA